MSACHMAAVIADQCQRLHDEPDEEVIHYGAEPDADGSCPTCGGSGGGPEGRLWCPVCKGTGWDPAYIRSLEDQRIS